MGESKKKTIDIQPVTNSDQLSNKNQIEGRILSIRDMQVMIDRDLAELYGVETKVLNQAVKRNIERFPSDFMFQLTKEECLRSQIVTLNESRGQHLKYMPYAFTEQGIAMLSGILHSKIAIEVNIRVMRAFVEMRKILLSNAQIFRRLEAVEYKQIVTDNKIDEIFDKLEQSTLQPKQGIFFDGQIYDAYIFVVNLVKRAKSRIVLVDNYVDETVLTLLDKRIEGVNATIYTQQIKPQLQLDIDKHNAQYPSISVNIFKQAHDRFLIIDKDVYHIGASIKDLGKKWFGFTLMQGMSATDIINRLNGGY